MLKGLTRGTDLPRCILPGSRGVTLVLAGCGDEAPGEKDIAETPKKRGLLCSRNQKTTFGRRKRMWSSRTRAVPRPPLGTAAMMRELAPCDKRRGGKPVTHPAVTLRIGQPVGKSRERVLSLSSEPAKVGKERKGGVGERFESWSRERRGGSSREGKGNKHR